VLPPHTADVCPVDVHVFAACSGGGGGGRCMVLTVWGGAEGAEMAVVPAAAPVARRGSLCAR
jgi:hypothetical protein